MKAEVMYCEPKQRTFSSKKTLKSFLKTKLDSEILRALEVKCGIYYALELRQFMVENKYDEN